jgi:hypothetical protein
VAEGLLLFAIVIETNSSKVLMVGERFKVTLYLATFRVRETYRIIIWLAKTGARWKLRELGSSKSHKECQRQQKVAPRGMPWPGFPE